MNTADWRILTRWLRATFPVSMPVLIRRWPMKRQAGMARFNGCDYRICISTLQDEAGQKDTLLHEWSHVLAIEEAYQHQGRWAEFYGKVFHGWEKEFA